MNDKPIDSAVTSTGAAADIPRSNAGVTGGPVGGAATAGTTGAASTRAVQERAVSERTASERAVSEAGDITTSALAIRGLVKRFPGFTLDGIDLDVPRGYVVGLVGANGSGKTTTIGAAIGTIVPDEGQIAVPPMDRVGVVLDTPYFMRSWTPGRIEQAVRPFYPAWSEDRYRDLLARFRIRTSMRLKDLSRGQGKKLQAAVALAHDPELLILDEPTAGLDPLARDEFLDVVAEFMEDEAHAVLFSSHITSDLERVADYVTVLDHGRVVTSAPTHDLIDGFRVVRGGVRGLTDDMRRAMYGFRLYSAGFEGLARTEEAATWRGDLVCDPPTLDQIVVGVAKGRPSS